MFSSNTSQVSEDANYIEQVFATTLYTGNGGSSRIRIQNGVDVLNEGGLVWIKNRSSAQDHYLTDTARGMYGVGGNTTGTFRLSSNTTAAQIQDGPSASVGNSDAFPAPAVPTDGFFINATANANGSHNYASWTFRKQPKFFDVVTYTGTGSVQNIPHNLGSVPGCILIKCIDNGFSWFVYHRGLGATKRLLLNDTSAAATESDVWNNTEPTATNFTLGSRLQTNGSGYTYVAYLFAHDSGGFGLSGTDNVISCGSFTTDGSGLATVDLGYEPQYVLVKRTSASSDWFIFDTMRGLTVNNDNWLTANTADAESSGLNLINPTSTGFTINFSVLGYTSASFIYIAIRRGPMKTPTTGTSVFAPVFPTSTTTPSFSTGWPVDLAMHKLRASASFGTNAATRLQGTPELFTSDTAAESTDTSNVWSSNSGYGNGFTVTTTNIGWMFRRAPGFFDVVCYTGTGVARTVAHNLAAVPELMIVKRRNAVGGWAVYSASSGPTKFQYLNTTAAALAYSPTWNDTAPTSSVFTVGNDAEVNASGGTFVAYLFASCPGVSKVGSYTGNGSTQTINCGFTGGARFVLIKRTDSTGDWYVWDSARGIVAGNDPYLLLNSTAAEVTSTDYVDTYSAGFEISSTAPAAINASGGSFIFLAIA